MYRTIQLYNILWVLSIASIKQVYFMDFRICRTFFIVRRRKFGKTIILSNWLDPAYRRAGFRPCPWNSVLGSGGLFHADIMQGIVAVHSVAKAHFPEIELVCSSPKPEFQSIAAPPHLAPVTRSSCTGL
jgi:hypothetical protein